MTPLKKCPFCGGDADIWTQNGKYGRFVYCACSVCDARTRTFGLGKTDSDEDFETSTAVIRAYEAWNRRCSNAK